MHFGDCCPHRPLIIHSVYPLAFGMYHLPFGMHPFVRIDDHIVLCQYFGPGGPRVAFGTDSIASSVGVWLSRMALFGIGAHIVPLRAPF